MGNKACNLPPLLREMHGFTAAHDCTNTINQNMAITRLHRIGIKINLQNMVQNGREKSWRLRLLPTERWRQTGDGSLRLLKAACYRTTV